MIYVKDYFAPISKNSCVCFLSIHNKVPYMYKLSNTFCKPSTVLENNTKSSPSNNKTQTKFLQTGTPPHRQH